MLLAASNTVNQIGLNTRVFKKYFLIYEVWKWEVFPEVLSRLPHISLAGTVSYAYSEYNHWQRKLK